MTLTDFLLARVAEDEAMWRAMPFGPSFGHAELWQRMLTKCEAERRIVEAAALVESFAGHASDYTHGSLGAYRLALREMAAVYADHPDYRDDWRP